MAAVDPVGLDPAAPAARGWIALQLALALRPELAACAVQEHRDPMRALAALADHVAAPKTAAIDAARQALVASGARLVPLLHPAYPPQLARLPDPPTVLSVIGDLACLQAPCVAIVGPRAASAYGLAVARSLGEELAAQGAVVVSGLARGVDAAAHEGALCTGRTVAVQACGPERVYPAFHRKLASRIARAGALLTEMPPGTPPRPPYFPLRNRTISALCRAVVVVEARHRSGSLITARHALAQGIDVLAVPGPVDARTSEGTNALLRDGAAPALDASDVLPLLGLSSTPELGSAGVRAPGRGGADTDLASDLQVIVKALRHEPATPDALARRLSMAIEVVSASLLELELVGRVTRDRDGRIRVL